MVHENSYIIVTPAYNEAGFIEKTIESVLRQTLMPQAWIIVDDGSTDDTAEIVKKYADQYNFISYFYREKVFGQHYFASNVYAIMEGYEQIRRINYDFLAILDADIILPMDYYQKIVKKFQEDDHLGVASGIYENLVGGKLYTVLHDNRSTPKAIQIFRKEVFEEIGGFLPLKFGGEDTISCVMARMTGWKAWSFDDIKTVHLRPTGTGSANSLISARFCQGICEYSLAVHPLFFLLKVLRRAVLEQPYIIGSTVRLAGYIWAAIRREKVMLPSSVVKFVRKEQLARIFNANRIG